MSLNFIPNHYPRYHLTSGFRTNKWAHGILLLLVMGAPGCAQDHASPPVRSKSTTPLSPIKSDEALLKSIPSNIKPEEVARYVVEQRRKKQGLAMQPQAMSGFAAMMEIHDHHHEYTTMLARSRSHMAEIPSDPMGPFYVGVAEFYLGNFSASKAAWMKAKKIDPQIAHRIQPLEAQLSRVQRRFPTLELGPIRMVDDDAKTENDPYYSLCASR